MAGHLAAFGDPVPVQIEYPAILQPQGRQAGFLLRLLQRHRRQVGVAIGVAAGLEPAPELAVVHQQGALAVSRDQPGAAGEMPGQALAQERVVGRVQQLPELFAQPGLGRTGGRMRGQLLTQCSSAITHDKGCWQDLAHYRQT